MPFTRQRHNGTKQVVEVQVAGRTAVAPISNIARSSSPRGSSSQRSQALNIQYSKRVVGSALTGASLCFLSLAAGAKPAQNLGKSSAKKVTRAYSKSSHKSAAKTRVEPKLKGVWGWTTGSQTYLRVRPGAQTPPVAKVPRHTKLFVWGTFNGWYRVETLDNKFGWVYNTYISAPQSEKLLELSHSKARIASNRAGNQTLYGSPEMLRKYYARYAAPGAVKGLQKQGVRIATRTTTRSTIKTAKRSKATTLARSANRQRMARITDPTFNDVGNVRLAPSLPVTRKSGARSHTAEAPVFETNRGDAIESAESPTVESSTQESLNAVVAREAAQRDMAQRERSRREAAQSQAERRERAQRIVEARKAEQQRAVETQRLALLRAQEEREAQQLAEAKRMAEAARLAAAKAQRMARAREAEVARRKAAQSRAAARAARRQRLAQEKAQQRARLRERMGAATPPSVSNGIHPLTPQELMRAREEYLSSRYKSRPVAPVEPAPLDSASSVLVRPSSFSQTPQWTRYVVYSAYKRPRNLPIQPTNTPQDASEAPRSAVAAATPVATPALKNSAAKPRVAQTRATRRVGRQAKTTAKKTMRTAKKPMARAISRGGSPRDYARYAMNNASADSGAFGQGVATQALSYRGTPYVRGATSPGRGFDCSGLVYYILRQRGHNPPRTSSSMARYGKPVSRKAMQPGDIVFFAGTYRRGVSHVGIYIGNGNFVHAPRSGVPVRVDSMSSKYYASKFWGARRVK